MGQRRRFSTQQICYMKLQQQQQQKVFRYFQCFMKFGRDHDGNPDEIIVLMRAFLQALQSKVKR